MGKRQLISCALVTKPSRVEVDSSELVGEHIFSFDESSFGGFSATPFYVVVFHICYWIASAGSSLDTGNKYSLCHISFAQLL